MSMIIHNRCGSPIYLDLNNVVSVVTTFGITARGLNVGMGDLIVRETTFTPIFYCNTCHTQVPISDLEVPCFFCGIRTPLSRA